MIWHNIRDQNDPELDRLAEQYHLHPLHIEDCRHRNQAAKIEHLNDYLFVVLKPLDLSEEFELTTGDLDIFVGADWVITIEESGCRRVIDAIDRVRAQSQNMRPDQVLHRIVDIGVDSYIPLLDEVSERIDKIEDDVLENPEPRILQRIFELKRTLISMRRVFMNTRDVVGYIQRIQGGLIQPDLQPFFRDVYDHIARNLDLSETYRDLLTGSMDIYLSSVANRTNQVMKVLTVISTISLPAIVIAGIYGMNLKHLPWAESPHAWGIVTGMIFTISGVLLVLMRWFHWL
jgi:magnesium transporter